MNPLLGERVLVALTGSPSALSMPHQVLMMRNALATEVRVVMSRGVQRFLSPYVMRLFAGDGAVFTDIDDMQGPVTVPHVDLVAGIDLYLVMPATAHCLAKAAHGFCDDLVSTAIVACEAPVALVPAMNGAMWRSRAVQENVRRCRGHGYHVIEPGIGMQIADGQASTGAMPPLEHILDQLTAIVRGTADGDTADAVTWEGA